MNPLVYLMKWRVFTLLSPQFSGLYLVSLVVILIGFIAFNAVRTPDNSADPDTSSSSSSIAEDGCYDNPVATQRDITKEEVAVRITTSEEEEDGGRRRKRAEEDVAAVGLSTKM